MIFTTRLANLNLFKIADKVRIAKKKKIFDKRYTPTPSEEVLYLVYRKFSMQIFLRITDYNGEEIQGTFDEQELQRTSQGIFRIEKVIRSRCNKSLIK